ncbi:L-threonylcarbamoyladenylate synthase [Allofournierella sp.]|uniref:L-threonylcarbamoyladenylate synthase n=1 Tax=Allofournierella sp. TaxID=1940256 RepID=UPI003AB4A67E
METKLQQADGPAVALAAELLKGGGIVAIPTETVYGIAASALDGAAVKKIFEAKGRPQDNPLIVHIDRLEMLEGLVGCVPERAKKLAEAFWPGPLTMILPRGPRVAAEVCAGLDTVAVRMPSHPVARAVITACGLPLAAPSANLSGSPSPTTAHYVMEDMRGRLPLILDGGECQVGVESTVVSLAGPQAMLLRPGYITQEQLQEVLREKVLLSGAILEKLKEGETARSPGMKYKHYAPKAEVTIVKGGFQAYCRYVQQHAEPGTFCLCFAGESGALPVPSVEYGAAQNGADQAKHLFTALRQLDERGAKRVFARCPAATGVALAVYNRLLRAAAFRVVEA